MQHSATFETITALMALMLVATLAALAVKRVKMPFTVVLVVAGLALGYAARNLPLLHALQSLELTPDVVLFVFLPALVFESAFNMDSRALMKNIVPVSVLAAPGVVVSTAVVALILHHALGLSAGVSVLFGALISATDPVAVVALFKEMGAPKRLSIIVEGESLLNDGTALVLFKVVLGIMAAGALSAGAIGQGAVDFVFVVAGGAVVGLAMGALFAKLIERVDNDRLVEITLVAILAHSSYFLAEGLLHVSGVIATVVAGLTMGSYGRSKVSPKVLGHMEAFWEYVAFVCNSLIFLLVGLSVAPSALVQNAWPIAWATVAVFVARAASVFGAFAVMDRLKMEEPVQGAFQGAVFWGGLRGALAIVMALSIPESMPQRDMLLSMTVGVVLATLLVNGLSMQRFMAMVGLEGFTTMERFEVARSMVEAKRSARSMLAALADDEGANPRAIARLAAHYEQDDKALHDELAGLRAALGPRDEEALLLRQCLMLERAQYVESFEEGLLNESNLKNMMVAIERQIDRVGEGLEPYRHSAQPLASRLFHKLEHWPLFSGMAAHVNTRRLAALYEMHEARLRASRAVLKELDSLEAGEAASPRALERGRAVYHALHAKALAGMEQMRALYPEYVESAREAALERTGLGVELDKCNELARKGAMPAKALAQLSEQVGRKVRRLRARAVEPLEFAPAQLLSRVSYFSALPQGEMQRLAARLQVLPYLPGEGVIQEGEHSDSLYVVARGSVGVYKKQPDGQEHMVASLGAGEFFGEQALLHPQPRTATCRALTACTLLELKRARLTPVLSTAPALREALEQAALARAEKAK